VERVAEFLLPVLVFLLGGCAATRSTAVNSLDKLPIAGPDVTRYQVGCPDLLRVAVHGFPNLDFLARVEVNGCVDLGPLGGVRVEGLTPQQIREQIATMVGVGPDQVTVEVAEFASKQVYLFGEVAGYQRAVPYQGPERVTDLLRRIGGITPDGAPEQIRVVRPSPMPGADPEVMQVDLRAAVLHGEEKANVIVQPYDQIHVPESRSGRINKCVPTWFRPILRLLAGDS
jgi:protein involved in polysaccharide export with SLBB domain